MAKIEGITRTNCAKVPMMAPNGPPRTCNVFSGENPEIPGWSLQPNTNGTSVRPWGNPPSSHPIPRRPPFFGLSGSRTPRCNHGGFHWPVLQRLSWRMGRGANSVATKKWRDFTNRGFGTSLCSNLTWPWKTPFPHLMIGGVHAYLPSALGSCSCTSHYRMIPQVRQRNHSHIFWHTHTHSHTYTCYLHT